MNGPKLFGKRVRVAVAFFRGEIDKYTWIDIGSSYLPSELVGAFLYAQLEYAEIITQKRIRICQQYHTLLLPLQQAGYIQLPTQISNGHLFYILTQSLEERTQLIQFLKQHQIYTVFHYIPLTNVTRKQLFPLKFQITN